MGKKLQKQYADPRGSVIENSLGRTVFGFTEGAPTASIPGVLPGAIIVDVTNGLLYYNSGTATSATFTAFGTSGSPTFTTATVTTLVNTAINASAAAATLTVKANTTSAWGITDGTTVGYINDTRNTVKDVASHKFTGQPATVATEAAAHINPTVQIAAKTITYTGTNTVTSSLGAQLHVGIPTFTDASAGTLSLASTVHVSAVAAAGGSLTLSAARMISTTVSDCYLTNAGVWTDTACWESGKEFVSRAIGGAASAIHKTIDKLIPATWQYKEVTALPGVDEQGNPTVHETRINDLGRDRVGIVYDDLPGELRAPGEERGVSAGILSSFALAAIRVLRDEINDLRKRLEQAEAKVAQV